MPSRRALFRSFRRAALPASMVVGALLTVRTLHLQAVWAQSAALVHYELPFGTEHPFAPSNAGSELARFLRPAEIPSAAYCQHCHADVHTQWRESAHANSFRTPWYIKNVSLLQSEKGAAAARHCEGCHNPVALLTGALSAGSTVARPHDNDGVTCMVCHSIRSASSLGTGSYVMGQPAVMLDPAGKPVPGLPTDAAIRARPDLHAAAVIRPVLRSADFCASCHTAALPQTLNGYKWLRTFDTWNEWQQSSWSAETPLSFYSRPATFTCQSCHMPAVPARDPSAHAGTVPSHRWPGANTAIPTFYGFAQQLKTVEDFLRNDQIELDLFRVTVERPVNGSAALKPVSTASLLGDPRAPGSVDYRPGDWLTVDLVVRNKGVGHSLVPELRDFYESWVEFSATGADGRPIYISGGTNADHQVDPDARTYTNRIVGRDGAALTHHEIWRLYVKTYDATVASGRSDVVRYRFRVPEHAGPIRLGAAVRYRRFNRLFTDWAFGDAPSAPDRFPTVTLAEARYDVTSGSALTAPQTTLPAGLTPALRWNNYGIGLLDRQQPEDAAAAFREVVHLDPAYEPGRVNVAIAEYTAGRYAESQSWLDRALAMRPDDARALFYRGLNLRWTGHYDQAIAALQPVAARYPRFRQVHQELGYMLLQLHRPAEARAEFEQVLAVDPDDALAHRWLAPTLLALGDRAGAARESVRATETANDPAAGFTAQRFWRDHVDVAARAMPHHVYSAQNTADDPDVHRVLNLQNLPSYIWQDHIQ